MFHLQRPALGTFIAPQAPSEPSPTERDPRSQTQSTFMPQPELAAVLQDAVALDCETTIKKPVEELENDTQLPVDSASPAPADIGAFFPMGKLHPHRPKQTRKRKKKGKRQQRVRNLPFQYKRIMPKTRQGGQRHLRFISERLQESVMPKVSHGFEDVGFPLFAEGAVIPQLGEPSASVFEDPSYIQAASTIQRAVRTRQAGIQDDGYVDRFFQELVADVDSMLNGTPIRSAIETPIVQIETPSVVPTQVEENQANQAAEIENHELLELEKENRRLREKLLEKKRQAPLQHEQNQVKFQRKLSSTELKKNHLRKKRDERKQRLKLGEVRSVTKSAPAMVLEKRRPSLFGINERKHFHPTGIGVVPAAIDTTRGRALAHAYGRVRRPPKYDGYARRNR